VFHGLILQSASLDDSGKARTQALRVVLQIALENSGGALKMKVAEVPGDRSAENLLTPTIIDILESEPMLSVSKQS
jgi:fatty acid synthase